MAGLVSTFRAVADVHEWDKSQRALQLVSYLDETAMNVAQELGNGELYDYDILVKLLGDRFDPASCVSASRSRFHGLSRRHHEDADSFADTFLLGVRVVGPATSTPHQPTGPRPATLTPYRPATATPYRPATSTPYQPATSTPYQPVGDHSGGDMFVPRQPPTLPACLEIFDTSPPLRQAPQETRQGYRPAAPIQHFNNKSLSWPAWFRHFRAVADVHGWDKNQRALQLVDDELYDYDILVKLLGDWFDPASCVSASRSRFHGLSRRHHEDADSFADAIT